MSQRAEKINQLIKQKLGEIITKEIDLPGDFLVTITRITTSPDLKHSKIFISVIPQKYQGSALKILRKNRSLFNQHLKKQLTINTIPKLQFFIDQQAIYASQIDKLLDEIK